MAIKDACLEAGVRAERVDEAVFTGDIVEKIVASIGVAGLVIADLSHERPNVYYEIGVAHTRGKLVILVAREGTKLHFDIRNNKVLFFRDKDDLRAQLTRTVRMLRQLM